MILPYALHRQRLNTGLRFRIHVQKAAFLVAGRKICHGVKKIGARQAGLGAEPGRQLSAGRRNSTVPGNTDDVGKKWFRETKPTGTGPAEFFPPPNNNNIPTATWLVFGVIS